MSSNLEDACGAAEDSGAETAARLTRSAAARLLPAFTGRRFAGSTQGVRRLLHLGGNLQFFADRLARVGLEVVGGRATILFRRSPALFGFAPEPLGEDEDLVAMPPRFVGSVTRLLGAQSHFLRKTTQLFRVDAPGLRLGPPPFRSGARGLCILATSLTPLPLPFRGTARPLPALSASVSHEPSAHNSRQ